MEGSTTVRMVVVQALLREECYDTDREYSAVTLHCRSLVGHENTQHIYRLNGDDTVLTILIV